MGSRAGLDGCENLSSLEFDPRTVHPVASHYIDCVTPAHLLKKKTALSMLPKAK
jgi:hypothetical protein